MNSASLDIYGVFVKETLIEKVMELEGPGVVWIPRGARVLIPSELPCGVNKGEVCPTVNEGACFIYIFCIKVLSNLQLFKSLHYFRQKQFLKKGKREIENHLQRNHLFFWTWNIDFFFNNKAKEMLFYTVGSQSLELASLGGVTGWKTWQFTHLAHQFIVCARATVPTR